MRFPYQSDLLSRPPLTPNILTIGPTLQLRLLLAIPVLHHALLDVLPTSTVFCAHAEPKVVPVVGAAAQLSVAVNVVEMAAE